MALRQSEILLALLSGAALVAAASAPSRAAEELRIGLIAPMTGPFAQVGKDMVDGFNMYLEENKGEFAGAKVKLIVEDDQAKPDTGVTKAKKLILQDKVHMLVGGVLASTGYALAPVSTADKTVYIASVPAADDLTQRDLDQISVSHPHRLDELAAASALGAMGLRAGLQEDRRHRRRLRVRLRGRRRLPEGVRGLRRADRPEDLAAARHQGLRAVHSEHQGRRRRGVLADGRADGAAIPQAASQSGYKKPIIGGGTSYDEFALPFMGDEVIGDVSALQYSAALETPKNEAFVKQYRTKYGKVPSYFSETNYTTAHMIHEVMKGTNGAFPGPEQFVGKMSALKVDTPRGPVSFDDMRNPVQNIYIKKVEKKKMFGYDKDELWNTVIKTYPNVSQFWTYGKEAFLKQPVYSRDFPPCKYC